MQKYTSVEAFLDDLSDDQRAMVHALRKIILEAEPSLAEHIKWNAPSYMFDGEDRITFNLLNKANTVKLVFHMGIARKENKDAAPILHDDSGMIEWASDIRGMMTFDSLDDIRLKEKQLREVIANWLRVY